LQGFQVALHLDVGVVDSFGTFFGIHTLSCGSASVI
jgi:hypothetical protein